MRAAVPLASRTRASAGKQPSPSVAALAHARPATPPAAAAPAIIASGVQAAPNVNQPAVRHAAVLSTDTAPTAPAPAATVARPQFRSFSVPSPAGGWPAAAAWSACWAAAACWSAAAAAIAASWAAAASLARAYRVSACAPAGARGWGRGGNPRAVSAPLRPRPAVHTAVAPRLQCTRLWRSAHGCGAPPAHGCGAPPAPGEAHSVRQPLMQRPAVCQGLRRCRGAACCLGAWQQLRAVAAARKLEPKGPTHLR